MKKNFSEIIYSGILYVLVMMGIWGCGIKKTDESPTTPIATDAFQLHGSVTSAFSVTVDNQKFPDMESYYTAEVGQLSDQAAAAGYPGYDAKFDAQIGYQDLSNGMTVYVSPEANRGYAGQTNVGSDGNFTVVMPAAASGDTYQVKATKRISLTLTNQKNAKDIKKFCWNFNAQNLSVPYSEKDKPIVLVTFVSTITAYQCQVDTSTGITIPKNSSGTTALSLQEQMAALPAPALTDDLIYVGTSANPLVRSHGRSSITEVKALTAAGNTLTYGGATQNLVIGTFAGTPYLKVTSQGHGLRIGDLIYLQGTQSGLGFAATDLNKIFVVELVPTADSFMIRAARNATATGTVSAPGSLATEIAIRLTETSPVWTTTDGQATETTESGVSYTIDATGKICTASVCK